MKTLYIFSINKAFGKETNQRVLNLDNLQVNVSL